MAGSAYPWTPLTEAVKQFWSEFSAIEGEAEADLHLFAEERRNNPEFPPEFMNEFIGTLVAGNIDVEAAKEKMDSLLRIARSQMEKKRAAIAKKDAKRAKAEADAAAEEERRRLQAEADEIERLAAERGN